MKTVRMYKDFDYKPRRELTIAYLAGRTYQRVPEAAANAIKAASAGEFVASEKGAEIDQPVT